MKYVMNKSAKNRLDFSIVIVIESARLNRMNRLRSNDSQRETLLLEETSCYSSAQSAGSDKLPKINAIDILSPPTLPLYQHLPCKYVTSIILMRPFFAFRAKKPLHTGVRTGWKLLN